MHINKKGDELFPQKVEHKTYKGEAFATDRAVNVLQRMCKLLKQVEVWVENTSGT